MLPSTSKVPAFIAPQPPMLSAEPPAGAGWIEEIKHDGFRTLLRMDRGQAQAFTRSGLDWSDKYQRVIEACRKLRCRSALIDGEIIVQDEKGVSDLPKSTAEMFSAAVTSRLSKRAASACSIGTSGNNRGNLDIVISRGRGLTGLGEIDRRNLRVQLSCDF